MSVTLEASSLAAVAVVAYNHVVVAYMANAMAARTPPTSHSKLHC